ncbi:MAG: hypothetical protein ACTMIR_05990 [Cellulomonadaceae bacterium]
MSPAGASTPAPKRRRARSVVPSGDEARPTTPESAWRDLLARLRCGLRSEDPLDLLVEISTIVEMMVSEPVPAAVGSEGICGCGASADSDPRLALDRMLGLIDLLDAEPFAETTAAMRLIREFICSDEVIALADTALRGRRHPMPIWLAHLDEARVEGEVMQVLSPHGDNERLIWGVRMAGGVRLTAEVAIDHSAGNAMCDGGVRTVSVDEVVDSLRSAKRDGAVIGSVDAADARVRVEHAMSAGLCAFPGRRSDTWSAHRSVVLWALRLMPEGGAYGPHEVTAQEIETIVRDFFDSPHSRGLAPAGDEDAVRVAVGYAASSGANPRLWSPTVVERFLLDWAPAALEHDADGGLLCALEDMPYVLGALIPFLDEQRGLPTRLTEQTVRTLDTLKPDFSALLDAMYEDDLFEDADDDLELVDDVE